MKKVLSLVLALLMLLSAAAAVAEEIPALDFDPALMDAMEGEFVALEEFGLMFYLPADMQAVEVTEEEIANGGYAGWTNGTYGISIGYSPIADDAGNPLNTVEEIAAYYNASGIGANVVILNGIYCVSFSTEDASLFGVAYAVEGGNVLAFTFPGTVEAAAVLSSIMPVPVEE